MTLKTSENSFEAALLWSPPKERLKQSQMAKWMTIQGHSHYEMAHEWSIKNSGAFWQSLFTFFPILKKGDLNPACLDHSFKTYAWFPNVRLNFAHNLLRFASSPDADKKVALTFIHESGKKKDISYQSLGDQSAALQKHLKNILGQGDGLAAFMPNIPETVVAMLAATSLGATFTSTSCDFGVEGVVDRFFESKPKVLVAATGYEYNGKYFDNIPKIIQILKKLPFLEEIIVVDFLQKNQVVDAKILETNIRVKRWGDWKDLSFKEMTFEEFPFSHPLYIMYSSGTTGKPKCIVHGAGGVLLQHIKELGLHSDLTENKSILFFTTCGWMMWNWLVSSLFFGAKVVLYEGSPSFPSLDYYFEMIDREGLNLFGTGPKFLKALEDSGYKAKSLFPTLETIISTGSPLLPEQYDYVYKNIKTDVLLGSISGGTDIIGCFMLMNPTVPVWRGEIQSLGLGMDVCALDENGNKVVGKEGELVCAQSFPSRPLYFLNDPQNEKLQKAYFLAYEGYWHHGDFIRLSSKGTVAVFGRSDATLNPGGVRIGTAEIYAQTERLDFIADSLCVGKANEGDVLVYLYVKTKSGNDLTLEEIQKIKDQIRKNTTPRHVPAQVFTVSDIPYTRSGKKMELAVSRLINGREITNLEAVANPECLSQFKTLR